MNVHIWLKRKKTTEKVHLHTNTTFFAPDEVHTWSIKVCYKKVLLMRCITYTSVNRALTSNTIFHQFHLIFVVWLFAHSFLMPTSFTVVWFQYVFFFSSLFGCFYRFVFFFSFPFYTILWLLQVFSPKCC